MIQLPPAIIPVRTLVLFFSEFDTAGPDTAVRLRVMRSQDKGATWSAPITVADALARGSTVPETGTAIRDGANIGLTIATPGAVKFYYSHDTHWIADNKGKVIAVAPGSFQSELGCPGDWQPDCLKSWLQDPDGDGVFTLTTTAIPPGALH